MVTNVTRNSTLMKLVTMVSCLIVLSAYFSISDPVRAQIAQSGPNMTDLQQPLDQQNIYPAPPIYPVPPLLKINGSIDLNSVVADAVTSKIKVRLSQAVITAEQSVGNKTYTIAAGLQVQDGYLVYSVSIVDPNRNMKNIIVDPATGKVLASFDIAVVPDLTFQEPIQRLLQGPKNQ